MGTISPGFAAKMARLHGAKMPNPGAASGAGDVHFNKPGKPSIGNKPSGNAASRMASLLRLKAALRSGSYQMGGDGQRDQLASAGAGGKSYGGATPQVDESPRGAGF